MYREIVEVVPEPDRSLFVRFQDGLTGHVRLPEELMGVLAPLREASFSHRIFIDHGAVAWPVDIDLAPGCQCTVKSRCLSATAPHEPAHLA